VASIFPNLSGNAISYAKFFSRAHDAVIRVYDAAGNVGIETHEHAGDFKEPKGACRGSENDSAS
jgi:hypothetical protein